MATATETSQVLTIEQEIEIKATPEAVFRGLIEQMKRLGPDDPEKKMTLTLEEWPGGRWFRDLGDNTGHLWGHVQSIKPPTLFEVCGPLFMSFAAANNVIVRIEATETGSRLKLRHQCNAVLPEGMGDGMEGGWCQMLEKIKAGAEG